MIRHDIVLATINARYIHTAFGLRWLWANLGSFQDRAVIREFHSTQPIREIAETLLNEGPRVLGLGVYIWNVGMLTEVVRIVKAARPETVVVVGGPEISHEYEDTEIFRTSDYLIRGEGEETFARLVQAVLNGRPPSEKVLVAQPPELDRLSLPYDAYTDADVARRMIYVEASRGCPFRCAFCLSSLDTRVREFPLDGFLEAMDGLIRRGALHFTFVDRTFNLRADRADAILWFFLSRWREGMQLHLEIVPDRLTPPLLARMAEFPASGLHLETGVQSFHPPSLAALGRTQDCEKAAENLQWLRANTRAWVHADLIAGLPGETWESFAGGFDRLLSLGPQQIQIGLLKRLRGTPIARDANRLGLVFARHPPYEILETPQLDAMAIQRLKRFARYFELYHNSRNFPEALPLLWRTRPSAFDAFMMLADALWAATGRTHALSLAEQAQHLHQILIENGKNTPETIGAIIERDFRRLPGRKDRLSFLTRTGTD